MAARFGFTAPCPGASWSSRFALVSPAPPISRRIAPIAPPGSPRCLCFKPLLWTQTNSPHHRLCQLGMLPSHRCGCQKAGAMSVCHVHVCSTRLTAAPALNIFHDYAINLPRASACSYIHSRASHGPNHLVVSLVIRKTWHATLLLTTCFTVLSLQGWKDSRRHVAAMLVLVSTIVGAFSAILAETSGAIIIAIRVCGPQRRFASNAGTNERHAVVGCGHDIDL